MVKRTPLECQYGAEIIMDKKHSNPTCSTSLVPYQYFSQKVHVQRSSSTRPFVMIDNERAVVLPLGQ
jgi:hypothetical protein